VNRYLEVLSGSLVTFTATNLDDAFLLTLFFARRIPPRRVVAGQYLGFAILIVVSVMGAFAALAIPHRWIRLLGLLPLALGIKHLFHTRRGLGEPQSAEPLGLAPVALITLSNGADNVGVYVPFFVFERSYLWLILIAYAVLVGAWCWVGSWLGSRPVILALLGRWGDRVTPFIFISLGISILFLG